MKMTLKSICVNVLIFLFILFCYHNLFKDSGPNDVLNNLMIETTLYDLEFHKLEIQLSQYDIFRLESILQFQVKTLERYKKMDKGIVAEKEIFSIENEIIKTRIDLQSAKRKLDILKGIDDRLTVLEKELDEGEIKNDFFIKRKRIKIRHDR